ncbi:MAG: phytoene/squalene synthase family protein [Bryobacterales bacterium]|nr:phytoene/squalene synthase family protein [Bryobacterales bacterium]
MRLDQSYQHCRQIARHRAKNFYYAFRLLDPVRRDALCAIYAFMRQCDDLSDEPGATRDSLEAWRAQLDSALAGRLPDHPVWPAFVDTVKRYRIPTQYFHDMVDGVSSDLTRSHIETFDELYRYCYQVASVAGLSLIHIFGFDRQEALVLAEKCGIAFQLTNILRDVREDALLGRTYLPAEDLARFGVTNELLRSGVESDAFRTLMRFEAARARAYFHESRPLTGMVDPSCRKSLGALIEIYSRLLARIEQSQYAVLQQRVRLSTAEKSWILVRSLWTSY